MPILGGCMSTSLLEIERVNTFYGDSHILFDVSLHVKQHEVVALLGRNGAGKTTCLNAIVGVLPPRAGTIHAFGQPIGGLAPERIARRGIALVPQGREIFPQLTVEENLATGLAPLPETPETAGSLPTLPWQAVALGVWLAGALLWWAVAGWRVVRFRRLLRLAESAPPDVQAEAGRLARRIAAVMPALGSDRQRGGWYDVMERLQEPGEEAYRFAFHDRKAWWQQEQAILAYYILAGVLGDKEYLRLAREAAAFYNAFFLDHDDGAVYFNVLASGIPYVMGTERFKGSHSMSGYHAFELCYLAQVYMNLLLFGHPLDLYFKPRPRTDGASCGTECLLALRR